MGEGISVVRYKGGLMTVESGENVSQLGVIVLSKWKLHWMTRLLLEWVG